MLFRVIFFTLIINFQAVADDIKKENYDVMYRNSLGLHRVEGKKINAHRYQYNLDTDRQLTLTTLEWNPYIGEQICRQGWVLQVTIALLHSIGYGATVTFYPWGRAIAVAEYGKADILFPEYYIEPSAPSDVFPGTLRLDHLILSDVFGRAPIAFIKLKGYDTSHYVDLMSLVNERIGVVRGYQNTPEFDRLMDAGSFDVVQAKDDLSNLNLLLYNRVNLIVGDPSVIDAAIKNSSMSAIEKKRTLEQIQVVEPILKMNGLFFAMSKNGQYAKTLPIELNQAIRTFKEQGIFEDIRYTSHHNCENVVVE